MGSNKVTVAAFGKRPAEIEHVPYKFAPDVVPVFYILPDLLVVKALVLLREKPAGGIEAIRVFLLLADTSFGAVFAQAAFYLGMLFVKFVVPCGVFVKLVVVPAEVPVPGDDISHGMSGCGLREIRLRG